MLWNDNMLPLSMILVYYPLDVYPSRAGIGYGHGVSDDGRLTRNITMLSHIPSKQQLSHSCADFSLNGEIFWNYETSRKNLAQIMKDYGDGQNLWILFPDNHKFQWRICHPHHNTYFFTESTNMPDSHSGNI